MASSLFNVRDNSWAPVGDDKVPFDPVGVEAYGKCAILTKRPAPQLDESCFTFEDRPLPETLKEGTALVKNTHLSMDPTHFIWSQEIPQYMPAVGLGTVMRCLTLGRVVKTTDPVKFPVGKVVSTFGGVAEYCVVPFAGLNETQPDVPVEMNLGPFSLIQGHTAWVGLQICALKKGDTLVVSGAAGAVGSLAAQLGKLKGARVVGIAGGSEKCAYVTGELGVDACVDYKNSGESVGAALKRLCPNGVDAFFDNVGGPTLDAVVANMNCFGRISICGAISQYEGQMGAHAVGFKSVEMLLMRRLTVQGFVVVDHLASVQEAMAEIGAGVQSGAIKWKGDVRSGSIGDYVSTVNLLLSGGNHGKLILKLPEAVTPTLKLIYFNGKGVVEPARIMLAVAGEPYEDFRFPIDVANGYARPEFDAAQAAGAFALNMNRLPILEVGGAAIAQSKAIDRFVARRCGFMGSSELEAGLVDMVAEHCSDIKKAYGDARAGKAGDDLVAAKAAFLCDKLPEWAAKLEASLVAHGSETGFAVGTKLSYADVRLFDLFADFFDAKDAAAAALAGCPRVSASVAAVRTAAAGWLASRPVTAI